MKGRFFWISLVLIGISWTANTIYAHSKQLDAPIFLDHYFNTAIPEGNVLTLYYLTNKNDISAVSHVRIGDVTGYVSNNEFNSDFNFDFYLDYDVDPNIDVFTHHALRAHHIELNSIELEAALKDGPFTFNDMDVTYNDGKSVTVPIGEITLNSDYPTDNGLDSISSSGSTDGSSEYIYSTDKGLSIDDISVDFEEVIQDYLSIKIKNSNIPGIAIQDLTYPYQLEKNEKLYIQTKISSDFIGLLNSFITISGTTESNNNFTTSVPLYSQLPYLEQEDINKIIKEKGGGGVR